MKNNTYTDIYNGFVEREEPTNENQVITGNKPKQQTPVEKYVACKKEDVHEYEEVVYTDIYNGCVDRVEKEIVK